MRFPSFSRLASPSILWSILLAAVLLLVAGCKNEPLTIGVVLPLSGEDAEYGQATRAGLELALSDLQSRGEAVDLRLEFHDSASDPAAARAKVEELFDGRVIAAVAGLTPEEARAVAPLADELERVILSPAASDQSLSQGNRHFYRLAPSAEMIGTTVATFAANTLDLDSLVLIAENAAQDEAYGASLSATFERLQGQAVERHVGDVGAAVSAVRSARPDAVMVAGWGDWLASTVEALRSAGYRGKIFTPESFAAPGILEDAGRDARGVMIAQTAWESGAETESVRRFFEAWNAVHEGEPGLYAAYAWDAVQVLAAALEDRPHLPGEVRSWIRDLPDGQPGVTGHLQFDESGAATKYPRIYSVADDLELRDHGRWLEREKARIAEEKRKLRERLEETRRQIAASG